MDVFPFIACSAFAAACEVFTSWFEHLANLDPDLSHLYSDPAMTGQFWGLKKWVEYD